MSVIIERNGGKIVVNGKICRTVQNIGTMTINGGRILVDGKPLSELNVEDEKVINISIQGDIDRLEVDYCHRMDITGNVRRVKANQGDIEIHGNVEGDVHANMGSITCGNVDGDCHTNMGSINRR